MKRKCKCGILIGKVQRVREGLREIAERDWSEGKVKGLQSTSTIPT
jgi:hypothetical protein